LEREFHFWCSVSNAPEQNVKKWRWQFVHWFPQDQWLCVARHDHGMPDASKQLAPCHDCDLQRRVETAPLRHVTRRCLSLGVKLFNQGSWIGFHQIPHNKMLWRWQSELARWGLNPYLRFGMNAVSWTDSTRRKEVSKSFEGMMDKQRPTITCMPHGGCSMRWKPFRHLKQWQADRVGQAPPSQPRRIPKHWAQLLLDIVG
jgi:hypothetical protein